MAERSGDMICSVMHLPEMPKLPESVKIKRALGLDRQKVLQFMRDNFSEGWANEAETTLTCCPSHCVIAVENGEIIGVSCYDALAKGQFGPIGVNASCRGRNVGAALLLRTLAYMRDDGYAYAIIGWVSDAAPFYEKLVNATFIPGGEPQNSIYSQMTVF